MTQTDSKELEAIAHLIQTVHRLRAPGGCPWDQAQTHQSLRQYLIEEAYEVLDVIDQIHTQDDLKKPKIRDSFREELGDLLMQVLLHSEITQQQGAFSIYDVAKGLDEKLIRRHPHVFGDQKESTADSALQRWEKEKAKEKASQLDASILDGVPRGLPALQRAARVIEKVTKVGFQWNDMNGPLDKVQEELNELKVEVHALDEFQRNQQTKTPEIETQETQLRSRIEAELGDLFFTLCNIAYLMKINPETSLRGTMSRFEKRFKHVERKLKESGKSPEQSDLPEMDRYWDEAKKIEKVQVWGLTGGIASGKSTVAKIFSEFGIPVIDADQLAHQLSQPQGAAYPLILQRFGTADRAQLRNIVFNDPQAKKDLEGILHPLIQNESEKQIQSLALKHSAILYEATLLVETGRYQELSGLIVVEASHEVRLNRLQARSPMAPALAEKIIQSQMTDAERNQHADWVIQNNEGVEELREKIQDWLQKKDWISSK